MYNYSLYIIDLLAACFTAKIADRVAQNLENITENFQFSTSRTRILIGFIISTCYYVILIVNPMGRIMVRWKIFRKK